MRKLLIFGLLLIGLMVQGQAIPGFNAGVVAGQGGETSAANMITNGTFDDATNWTTTGTWTIGSGVASYVSATISILRQSDAQMVSSIQANTAYTLSFDISTVSPYMYIQFRTYSGGVTYISYAYYGASSHYDLDFTTPADVSDAGFQVYVWGDADGSIDNLELVPQ